MRTLAHPDADAVVRDYEGLAYTIARDYYAHGLELQDLVQEARIGVAAAVRDYDGTRPLAAFAALCARRQVITAVKTAHRGKYSALNTAVSLSTPMGEEADGELADVIPLRAPGPAEQVEAAESLAAFTYAFHTRLSDLERESLIGMANGLSIEELGGKSADNAIQRARKKLAADASDLQVVDEPTPAVHAGRVRMYVARQQGATFGADTARTAALLARRRWPEFATARLLGCEKCALAHDGTERRDTRGRPPAGHQRPRPMWRVEFAPGGRAVA